MPVRGSTPSAKPIGAPEPRRSRRAPRYRSSRGLEGKSDRNRSTAAGVGTTWEKLAVERRVSCWNAPKKKVLSFRIGPPAVTPATLWLNTDFGVPFNLSTFETDSNRCDRYRQDSVP